MYNHCQEKGCTYLIIADNSQMDFSFNNYSTVCYALRHRHLGIVTNQEIIYSLVTILLCMNI